ncbi:hypothetical protein PTKU46_82870 [Paraburkholderia terrae]|uniref:hypothetical protein n=1 Tax=Paraburkholderia terrae TaxID=311230 RepID=UPI0030DE23F5
MQKLKMVGLTIVVVAQVTCQPGAMPATPMAIDWSACHQPDPTDASYLNQVNSLIKKYVAAAKGDGSTNISLGLNRIYGEAVRERRDHVRLHYIPVGPSRSKDQCALSTKDYTQLLAYRDASYYVMCRAEVGIGATQSERTQKDLKTLAYAAIYDFVKSIGVDMRAKPDEPTTPPGGYAACKRGAEDGKNDPFPSASDVTSFKSRLSLPESEKTKIGDPTKQ